MSKKDAIFAGVAGLSVAWIAMDFFSKPFGVFVIIFFVVLPALSVLGLWVAEILGRKFLFIHQAGKFALTGAFADVFDIKIFQFLFLFLPLPLLLKAISFVTATAIKYLINKNWAFEKYGKEGADKEILKFFIVSAGGLLLNVGSFYLFSRIEVGLPRETWIELCIIFAALVSAAWNFCGYKFLVFKK